MGISESIRNIVSEKVKKLSYNTLTQLIMEKGNIKESNRNLLISEIAMLVSAVSMGFIGLFVDFLSEYSVFSIVFFRGVFGTFFLNFIMIRTNSFKKSFLKESFKKFWKYLLPLVLVYPIGILFYFLNIQISGYAVAAFLLYTNGIFLLVILYITKEEQKISKVNILSFILAIVGVLIIMEIWSGVLLLESLLIGLSSAIILAFNIYLRKRIYSLEKKIPSNVIEEGNLDIFVAWWATVTLIIFFLPVGIVDLFRLDSIDVIICLLMGVIPTALAFTLYNIGVKNDSSGNVIILGYFEPFVATINTAIFLQKLSIFTVLGGILIIVANIIVIRHSKRAQRIDITK